jgi:hypothetical protein
VSKVATVVGNYLRAYPSEHAHPLNRALHVLGVPLAPWGGLVLLARGHTRYGLLAIVTGYSLQYLGHRIQGNQMGDWLLVKKVYGTSTNASKSAA